MKKLILFCSMAAIIATVAVPVSAIVEKSKMSPLMLANIEALAGDEEDNDTYAAIVTVTTKII